VILLDTHVFIFWVNGSARLLEETRTRIEAEPDALGVSAITLWEIAMLVQLGRLELTLPIEIWLEQALAYPKVVVVPLSPAIVVESARLPAPFHKDPADEIIVATARVLSAPLVTYDGKMLSYPHVTRL
jgi:PIN domain nuclease of toxin-antitoxin system